MKHALPVLAFAGFAAAASAQFAVHLSFDKSHVQIGETVVATLTATFTGAAGSYFSSASFDLIASNPGWGVAESATIGWGMPALGAPFGGVASGANLTGVFAAQQSLFGAVNTSNPFTIASFVITATGGGTLTYSVQASANAPGAFSYTDAAGGPFAAPTYGGAEIFTSDTIFIPTPGTSLLLALAALPVRRRRVS